MWAIRSWQCESVPLSLYNIRTCADIWQLCYQGLIELDMYLLWFNFILGSNFIFPCFKLTIIHYNTQKQKKRKFEPRIKLNHNIYHSSGVSRPWAKGGGGGGAVFCCLPCQLFFLQRFLFFFFFFSYPKLGGTRVPRAFALDPPLHFSKKIPLIIRTKPRLWRSFPKVLGGCVRKVSELAQITAFAWVLLHVCRKCPVTLSMVP